MTDFESERLEVYESYIDDLAEEVETSHGDFIFSTFTQQVSIGDGYEEADFVIELTVKEDVDRTIVLMSSTVEEGERKALRDVEDEEALKRARRYAANIENGAYYGLTDGEEVHVISLDPDLRLDEKTPIENLKEIVQEIIHKERRIKDSTEFVDNLKEFHGELEPYVSKVLQEKLETDEDFEERIRKFLVPIGRSYEEDEDIPGDTLNMLSMQATYLIIDKILFYYLILENEENLKETLEDEEYEEIFEKLKQEGPTPEEVDEEWSREFWSYLEKVFRLIQDINYAPVFDPRTSPLNEITLQTEPQGTFVLRELMNELYGKEKLSTLFDGPLLAKLYEGLIPPDLRWKWGQIYTPPEVTRLITEWAVQNPDDEVLDPACGTGRFLISAYEKLADEKGVELGEKHQEIMDQLHGIDINQFPAHLATMSLVSMNLGSFTEEVDIKVRDFFRFKGKGQTNFSPKESMVELTGQTEISKEGKLEGQGKLAFEPSVGGMDAIVMNPPYTRQEALGEEYKKLVREESLSGLQDKGKIKMSKRAGFYTYFMTHGTKFLKKNGRFGMIVQNSWLDVDYGKDVQKFLLDNYKIKAIIGTQKHRLIKTADVNTVIVLLEREEDEEERNQNHVKFVQLKKDIEWFEQNYGFKELIDLITEKEEHMDSDLRIISKTQKELEEEGMGATTYTGGKWGKYIRAPDIYFKILKKAGDKLVPLGEIAEVRFGIKTGANDFFYLPKPGETNKFFESSFDEDTGDLLLSIKDKKTKQRFEKQGFDVKDPMFRIEKEYWMHQRNADKGELEKIFGTVYPENSNLWVPNHVIKSPREIKGLLVDPNELSYVVLFIRDSKSELRKGIKSYVEWGEKWRPSRGNKYPNRPTCSSRNYWYNLGGQDPAVPLWIMSHNVKSLSPINEYRVFVDHNLFEILPEYNASALSAFLNSSFQALVREVVGRINFGQGVLKTEGTDIEGFLVPSEITMEEKLTKALENLEKRQAKSVFDEIGVEKPEDVSLDKVKPDRRELDKVIMEDILGLSKREQLEVYRGVVELVKNRLEKAKSAGGR